MTSDTLPSTNSNAATSEQRYRRPRYDVQTQESDYVIRVLVPGVPKDGVEVSLNGRNLEVLGHRKAIRQEGWKPVFEELNWDDYRLRLELNVDVDQNRISAQVEDGVLRLTLPKAEEAKPRRIEIQ